MRENNVRSQENMLGAFDSFALNLLQFNTVSRQQLG